MIFAKLGSLSPQHLWRQAKLFLNRRRPLPDNIIVTVAHGSFKIPMMVFPKLSSQYQMSPRLLLNFSDYGTSYLAEDIPEKQKVVPKYGRLVGDPNRIRNSPDLIRFEDFSGNKIFSKSFEKRLTTSWFHAFWLNKILNLSYKPFYRETLEKIAMAVEKTADSDKPIILIDVHDVGNLLLGTTKDKDRERPKHSRIPKLIISSAPDEQTGNNCFGTCPEYLCDFIKESFMQKCRFKETDIKINEIYLGGNVTRFFGNPWKNDKLRKVLDGRTIYALQLEFNRGIYMDESNQNLLRGKAKMLKNALMQTIHEINDAVIAIKD